MAIVELDFSSKNLVKEAVLELASEVLEPSREVPLRTSRLRTWLTSRLPS